MPETIDGEVLAAIDPDDEDWSMGLVRREGGEIELRFNHPYRFLQGTQVVPLGDGVAEAEARLEELIDGLRAEGGE